MYMTRDRTSLRPEGRPKIKRAAPARPAGRPKDPEKRRAIIEAARTMFLEHGFEAVSIDAVADGAGVSKMTVYSHFQDKRFLFAACVEANCSEMLAGLNRLDRQAASGDFRVAMVALGTSMLKLTLSPRFVTEFPRLLFALRSDPVLARAFYEAGPERMRATLARIIEAAAKQGDLVVDSPMDAADDLISLWHGHVDRRVLMGVEPPPSEAEIEQRARRGIEVFLRAYRP